MCLKALRHAGCCSNGQRLMLGSTRLMAFQSLADSGVQDGAVLHLTPADDRSFAICVMVRATFVPAPASDRPLLLVCSPAGQLSGIGAKHCGIPWVTALLS